MASANDIGYGFVQSASWNGSSPLDLTDSRLNSNTPKAAILLLHPAQTDATMTAGVAHCISLHDGTNSNMWRTRAKDAQASGNNAALYDDGTTADWEIEDHAGSLLLQGTLAMITNGVRLTATSGSGSVDAMVILFYGGDLQAKTDVIDLGSSAGFNIDVNTVGFNPDVVFFTKNCGVTKGVDQNSYAWTLGVASSALGEVGAYTGMGGSGAGTSRAEARTGGIPDGGNNQTYIHSMFVTTFDANGFTVVGSGNPGGSHLGYLALDLGGAGVKIDNGQHPSGTGTLEHTTTFEPGLVIMSSHHAPITGQTQTTNYASGMSIGFCLKDSLDQGLFEAIHEDGLSTSNTNQIKDWSNITSVWTENALTQFHLGAVSAMGATSFTLNYTVASALGTYWYVALEEGTPGGGTPPPPPDGVWTKQTGAGSTFSEQTGPAASWNKQTGPGSSWAEE